jgi:hypothetical protein
MMDLQSRARFFHNAQRSAMETGIAISICAYELGERTQSPNSELIKFRMDYACDMSPLERMSLCYRGFPSGETHARLEALTNTEDDSILSRLRTRDETHHELQRTLLDVYSSLPCGGLTVSVPLFRRRREPKARTALRAYFTAWLDNLSPDFLVTTKHLLIARIVWKKNTLANYLHAWAARVRRIKAEKLRNAECDEHTAEIVKNLRSREEEQRRLLLGRRTGTPTAEQVVTQDEIADTTEYCAHCGKEVRSGNNYAKFCKNPTQCRKKMYLWATGKNGRKSRKKGA